MENNAQITAKSLVIDKAISVWANVCRLLLGATFLFSGFTKAVDPVGFYYKLHDYLMAFGLTPWVNDWMLFGVDLCMCALEFSVGAFLLLGIRRGLSGLTALALMIFMTPLTLYLAIANPVSDCGCFGDAWILTNWQTFGKNVVLLIAAISVVKWRTRQIRIISRNMEWMISTYTILFVFALSTYCYRCLPIIDFRPYRIGVNITEASSVPEGEKLSVLETIFVMDKNGEQREFTLDEYPDSTWTFVDTRTVVKEPGYEPPIRDFRLTHGDTGEDITDSLLAYPGYTFLLVAHHIEEADDDNIDLINEIYDYSVEHGYRFYALTASSEEHIEQWRDNTGAEYPFCNGEDLMLKTIVRSNPGLLLLHHGTIINKWPDTRLPDEYELTGRLEDIPLGQEAQVSDSRTLGYVALWYVVPLLLVIAADRLWVMRRNRRKVASKASVEQQKNE